MSATQLSFPLSHPLESSAPLARRTDPETSHKGGDSVRFRSTSQKARLLRVYAEKHEATDFTAAQEAGVFRVGVCYWKRCSELRSLGLIAPTGRVGPGPSGEDQQICAITGEGIRVALELEGGAS